MNKHIIIVEGCCPIGKEEGDYIFINRTRNISGIDPIVKTLINGKYHDEVFANLLEKIDEKLPDEDFKLTVYMSDNGNEIITLAMLSFIKYIYRTRSDIAIGNIYLEGKDITSVFYLEEIINTLSIAGVKDIKKSIKCLLK